MLHADSGGNSMEDQSASYSVLDIRFSADFGISIALSRAQVLPDYSIERE